MLNMRYIYNPLSETIRRANTGENQSFRHFLFFTILKKI